MSEKVQDIEEIPDDWEDAHIHKEYHESSLEKNLLYWRNECKSCGDVDYRLRPVVFIAILGLVSVMMVVNINDALTVAVSIGAFVFIFIADDIPQYWEHIFG